MKNPNPQASGQRALLNVLAAEAARRGDSLVGLASALGVTYRRLAQWRSGEADIARASDRVMLACAAYLGVPAVLVLMLAGRISLELLLTPSQESETQRLQREMRQLLSRPEFAGIAPAELMQAHPHVQRFVGYLAAEVDDRASRVGVAWKWLRELSGSVDPASANGPGDATDRSLF